MLYSMALMFAFVASSEPASPPVAPVTTPSTVQSHVPTPVRVNFDTASTQATSPQARSNENNTTQADSAPIAMPIDFGTKLPSNVASEILNKDLEEFAEFINGIWDNELQTFFEPEIGVPQNQRHARLNVKIIPINAVGFGNKAFYTEYRQNGENGAVVRARVWGLSILPSQMAIKLQAYEPRSMAELASQNADKSRLDALKPSDFTLLNGCDILFKRRANGFEGETQPGACKVTHSDGRVLNVTERHHIGANAWDVSDIGVDARGQRVFGNLDDSPSHLRHAAIFNCWASFTQGSGNQLLSDLKIHDQGGEVVAAFSGVAPIRLRLRNVEWPISTNRPSLTLYLLQGNEDYAQIYAWSDPDAKRIALSFANFQASCTKE